VELGLAGGSSVDFSTSEIFYLFWFLALLVMVVYLFRSRGQGRHVQVLRTFAGFFLLFSLVLHLTGGFLWPPNQVKQAAFIEQWAIILFNREIEKNPLLQKSGAKKLSNSTELNGFEGQYKAWHAGKLIHNNRLDFISGGLNFLRMALDETAYHVSINYELGGRNFTAQAIMTPSNLEFEYERGNNEK
jgi:hypothetical protein